MQKNVKDRVQVYNGIKKLLKIFIQLGQMAQTKCQSCLHSENQKQEIQNHSAEHSQNSQINVIYIKCASCQVINCKPCFKDHFVSVHTAGETRILQEDTVNCEVICQECEQNDSRKFCENCEQHLCDKCSFRIHNKGKRAKHQLLNNDSLIRIEKLFFLNDSDKEEDFKLHSDEFTPERSLIVYGANCPNFIEDYEGLQTQDINKLTIDEIESCLNRYPLISLFSVCEADKQLTQLLMNMSVQCDACEDHDEAYVMFLGGFKIHLLVRQAVHKSGSSSSNSARLEDEEYDKVDENDNENDSLTTLLKTNTQISSPEDNKFRKKQSIDFSCGSKEQGEPIPDMNKLFKKSLKMSNRSLIIEIPQSKQYKESPIKSDREQGFIERNLNLLQNAAKRQKMQRPITLHLDENDTSMSTMNLLEQSQSKSNNEQSILLMGTIQDPQRDTSFNLMGIDQACSDFGNSMDQSNNIANTFSLLNVGNMSLSTDNSLRKRSKKLPIPYFQAMKSKNTENLNNSYGYMFTQKTRYKLEKKFRELAQAGTLMVSRKQLDEFNLKFDQKIIKKMKKNVCDQEIEYYSLNLQMISVQSITWVLESIKQDRMMPSQKLILSRLKECFNIKPAQKVWICIMKYFESSHYFSDKKEYDQIKVLPTIHVGKWNDQILLEYEPRWPYEDQEEPLMALEEWEVFKIFLNEYFKKSKQITGGRYGCVQYVKLNGPEKLRKCSLGRLSYFVQEAINKGLIRYHKTLLIQNYESFEKSNQLENNNVKLFDMQKQLKILTIQVTLIDIFLQAGLQTEVSLAQIPLTFKKMILFEVNLLQLGFPKLKNILHTLTDKLVLSSSKSHIKYQEIKNHHKIQELRMKLQQMMQYFISQMSQVISHCMSNRHNIIAQELYSIMNEKLGFVFDYRVCNMPDFYQFLIYYCHQTINLQFINGTFVAFPKHMGYMNYQYPPNHQMYYQNYQYVNGHYPNVQGASGHYGGGSQGYYGNGQSPFETDDEMYYHPKPHQHSGRHGQSHNSYGAQQYQRGNQTSSYCNGCSSTQGMIGNYQASYLQPPPQLYKPQDLQKPQRQHENYEAYHQSNQHYQHMMPQIISSNQPTQISTPKFNQSIEYINKKSTNIKTLQNFKWQSYLDVISNCEDHQEKNGNFETQSFTDYQSIYNILDDDNSEAKSKLSFPKTFIEKEGSCNNNQGQLHISKITPIDEKSDRDQDCDASLGLFDQSPQKQPKISILENSKNGRKSKGQHNRVYSTTEARTKHERMFSTTTAKN